MILGFTGTRRGLTPAQRAALPSVVAALPERVLHGGAVGADEAFHDWIAPIYLRLDPRRLPVEVHPAYGLPDRYRFWCRRLGPYHEAVVHLADEPLARNRLIVARCDRLLACPAEPDEVLRSGTWATVRYARKARKSLTIVLPDGTIREERR